MPSSIFTKGRLEDLGKQVFDRTLNKDGTLSSRADVGVAAFAALAQAHALIEAVEALDSLGDAANQSAQSIKLLRNAISSSSAG